MQDITYTALPFPLPEPCQRTLRMLSNNVCVLYADKETKTVGTKVHAAYQKAIDDLDSYVASLRSSIGIETTRPAIRARQ